MPAQWPTFINNVSTKLESRSADSRDQFAEFLANEYFTAVGQSQTTFGNLHTPGQKPILEKGFKNAFEEIYKNETTEFEDKFEMQSYADFFEPLPNIEYDFDPLCEVEKYTQEQQENLTKFKFFSFFESTCPPFKEPDFYAGIDFNKLVADNTKEANQQIENSDDGVLYATMTIIGFTPDIKYSFLYSINGVDQPIALASDDGILHVRVNTTPGDYTYTFKSVLDVDGNIIKEINKSVTVNINENGEADNTIIVTNPNTKEPRPLTPEMTEEERILAIAERIILQSDGSSEFKKWVQRLDTGYNKQFGRIVRNKVFELLENTENNIEIANEIPTLSETDLNINRNQYFFQSEHIDASERIPNWLTPRDYICKFTYIPGIDSQDNTVLSILINDDFEERNRIDAKINLYQEEKKKWWQLLRDWANSNQATDAEDESETSGDGYNIMAKAIIDYWKSTATTPFKPTPAVPPCNVPAPQGGIYTPISYGSEATLANDLRRAWNTGKGFSKVPLTPAASKAVASAVSVACAKHLLQLKFLYLGGITTPTGPVPMIGFVPLVI